MIGQNFKYDGSIVDLINKVFEHQSDTSTKISEPVIKNLTVRKIDTMSANIVGEKCDILEIDSMSCHIKNCEVTKKLRINSMSLSGSIKVHRDCEVNIDSMTNSLKITYL